MLEVVIIRQATETRHKIENQRKEETTGFGESTGQQATSNHTGMRVKSCSKRVQHFKTLRLKNVPFFHT